MKNVLIIAFHFPPQVGSSGSLRALKFCRYLPSFGWNPAVLTLNQRAYESLDSETMKSIPAGVPVVRAFALDTKRHLGFRGRYFEWMALPDRWVTWLFGAIPSGLLAIRKHRIAVIFSTFPVTSAILVGYLLQRLTGKPWVLDLRDSMTEANYPRDPQSRRIWRGLERNAIRRAARVIFTAPSTLAIYIKRYPELLMEKCLVISNGYDEEDFTSLQFEETRATTASRPLKLLHTGLIYPEERDPRPFFNALSRLKSQGRIDSKTLSIVLRASGSEDLFQRMIDDFGISDLVTLRPHIPYRQALQEGASADGLLLFQAANCDHQIPAKAYEYLRLRKPILALTTRSGDTSALLNEVGGATILDLKNEDEICSGLPIFLEALRSRTHSVADLHKLRRYTRRNQAEQLAACLSEVINEAPAEAMERTGKFARPTS
jgi:glycosyltransferase involved in cell wall biosynthesis